MERFPVLFALLLREGFFLRQALSGFLRVYDSFGSF